jgi:hypothetical protein
VVVQKVEDLPARFIYLAQGKEVVVGPLVITKHKDFKKAG